jgi:DNA-binding NarL/FixJ family response regulator
VVRRRILIIDDHLLVRRGLSMLIDNEPDLVVCGTTTHRDCFESLLASCPDLVITDLWLEETDGFGLIEGICASHPALPVLVVSLHAAPQFVRRALNAGALGYVSKQEMDETLLIAIRRVLERETYVSPKMRAQLDSQGSHLPP